MSASNDISPFHVFFIILILIAFVALFVPTYLGWKNFDNHKQKPNADSRSLATALECYFVDYNTYPAMRPLRELASDPNALRAAGGWDLFTVEPGNPPRICGLTTPIAYLIELMEDHHSSQKLPYAYYGDQKGWIFFSCGPDGDYDIVPTRDYDSSTSQPSPHLLFTVTYDPTNGAQSNGDVWRIKY